MISQEEWLDMAQRDGQQKESQLDAEDQELRKKDAAVAKALRSPRFLKKLEDKQPDHSVCAYTTKSKSALKDPSCPWHADQHGIVILNPNYIGVCGPDFKELKKIPFDSSDRRFYSYLFVTEDLIGVDIRQDSAYSAVVIFDRQTCRHVETFDMEMGHLFVGHFGGRGLQLFLRQHHHRNNIYPVEILQLQSSGKHRTILQNLFNECDYCSEGKKRYLRMLQYYLMEDIMLSYCYSCTEIVMYKLTCPDHPISFDNYQMQQWWLTAKNVSFQGYPSENTIALLSDIPRQDGVKSVALIDLKSNEPLVEYHGKGTDFSHVLHAVSKDYLVIAWRNIQRKDQSLFSHIRVIDRNNKTEKVIEVPDVQNDLGALKFVSPSIMIAMPIGSTCPETGLTYEHVYTMDLAAKNPELSVLNFKVPVSEVRAISNNKIVCKISAKKSDCFLVFSLFH